jgi:hypothetical protein
MKIRILESASQDLIDGFHFYEKQSIGLGNYFIDSLFSDIDSLQIYAGIHPIYFGYHRMLSKRFPFAIYYKISDNEALVYAVLDCRRSPALIRKQLNKF